MVVTALVVEPYALVITTSYSPDAETVTLVKIREEAVAPETASPLRRHW